MMNMVVMTRLMVKESASLKPAFDRLKFSSVFGQDLDTHKEVV